MFKNLLVIFLLLFNFSVYGEDNLLTLKQQLDRLQREVNDLSKLTFQRDNYNNNKNNNSSTENSVNVTAFDLRIYDIEKDIKTLNSNFEDLVFQVDEIKSSFEELSIGFEELSIRIDTALINKVENTKTPEISSAKINNEEDTENNEEDTKNTLGTLKINSEDLSEDNEEEANNNLGSDTQNLKPEDQFQLAFDLLRSQKFDQAKKALKKFIADNTDNELAGSAHYWLGEIHLLKKDYREAALVFAEGYQKYPSSIKAPENLYKLAEALSKIDKKNEACNTFEKFLKEYIDHKLVVKINSKISELECK